MPVTAKAERKLWRVFVTIEEEATVHVWADSETEAERIAESDAYLDPRPSASAHELEPGELKDDNIDDPQEVIYGEAPPGPWDSPHAVTLGEVLDWTSGNAAQFAAYAEFKQKQGALFACLDTKPLPCDHCGARYPAALHAPECPSAESKER